MLHLSPFNILQLEPNYSSVQFNQAIIFCKDWLNGKQQFTFHTSGSTGSPKKIELSRTQLEASAKGTIDALQLSSSEKIFVCLNTQLIAGAMMLVRGLVLQGDLFIEDTSVNPLKNLPLHHQLTFASFVPMQLSALLNDDDETISKLNSFKHILIGGTSISNSLEEKISRLKVDAFHTYGMTETVSHIALRKIGKEKYFTTLNNVSLKKDDRDCLCVKSPSTNNNWTITNDVVELINEKQFVIKGRFDNIINTGGLKVQTEKVEEALLYALSKIGKPYLQAFITFMDDEIVGQKIIAVLQTPKLDEHFIQQLKNELQLHLTKYEIPKQFFPVIDFEFTSSGKINKKVTLLKALNSL